MDIDEKFIVEILRRVEAADGRPVRDLQIHDRSPVEISAHVRYMNERGLIEPEVIDPIQTSAPAPPWVIWDITPAGRAML